MSTASSAEAAARPALSKARTVEAVHRSTTFHWVGNGFDVSTYFPSQRLPAERVSPFVMMDYGPPKEFAPLASGKRGVGWHPHRGFETVTLAWEGSVAHRDNAGHAGIIGPGDVQWMTAGSYQPIVAADIPSVPAAANDERSVVRVIAGEYAGARGPAKTRSPLTMLDVRLGVGAHLEVPLPASYNALAVVAEGKVQAGDRTASPGELVLFANDGASVDVTATEASHLILLAGEPLGEPIVQYGPFVMNTVQEIQQAIHDVERGRFGPIPGE